MMVMMMFPLFKIISFQANYTPKGREPYNQIKLKHSTGHLEQ